MVSCVTACRRGELESVTSISTMEVPAAVGVPEIVGPDNARPAGSDPETIEKPVRCRPTAGPQRCAVGIAHRSRR